jgi:hypothetical protein
MFYHVPNEFGTTAIKYGFPSSYCNAYFYELTDLFFHFY